MFDGGKLKQGKGKTRKGCWGVGVGHGRVSTTNNYFDDFTNLLAKIASPNNTLWFQHFIIN